MTRIRINHTVTYEVDAAEYVSAEITEEHIEPCMPPPDLDEIAHLIPITEEEQLIPRHLRGCVKVTNQEITFKEITAARQEEENARGIMGFVWASEWFRSGHSHLEPTDGNLLKFIDRVGRPNRKLDPDKPVRRIRDYLPYIREEIKRRQQKKVQ